MAAARGGRSWRASRRVAERHARRRRRGSMRWRSSCDLQGAREAELARRRAADASSAAASQLAAAPGLGVARRGEPAALRAEERARPRGATRCRACRVGREVDGDSGAARRAVGAAARARSRLISQAEAAVPPDWGTASDAGMRRRRASASQLGGGGGGGGARAGPGDAAALWRRRRRLRRRSSEPGGGAGGAASGVGPSVARGGGDLGAMAGRREADDLAARCGCSDRLGRPPERSRGRLAEVQKESRPSRRGEGGRGRPPRVAEAQRRVRREARGFAGAGARDRRRAKGERAAPSPGPTGAAASSRWRRRSLARRTVGGPPLIAWRSSPRRAAG